MSGHYDSYIEHYRAQVGGKLPVFRGSPFQRGEGLGDIFRAVLRFLLPVASTAATTFIKGTADELNQGATLKDAAKGALGDTLRSGVGRAVERLTTGKGRSKRKKTTSKGGYKKGTGKKRQCKTPQASNF